MPPQIATLSQSSLQDYVDCAKRFQLRYVERLSYPAIESEPTLENEKHQREGAYFHRMVQQYLVGVPAEQITKIANTPNLQRWWENFLNSENLTGLTPLRSTPGVLRKDLSDLYPEATLSAPLGGFRLVAKYDLIAIENGKATIYDWKTYRKRPRDEWLFARMQTRVYRALLVHAGVHLNNSSPFDPEQIEMVYWFADFPNEPARFTYTSDQFKRDWDTLEKLAEEIESASSYPLTDDTAKCSYCPYRSYCDRGVRAGELEQAEAEFESDELFDVNFEQIGEIEF
jgi:CRISPR/Cas system-associated exonuclease Cas4 (RecB family)